MSKKSDDSLERFFKKAVAQQDLSHLDSDWKNMEKMLDDHAHVASAAKSGLPKKVATYAIVGALLFSGAYLAVVRPWSQAEHRHKQLATPANQDPKPSQAAAGMLGPLSGTKENPSADLLSSNTSSTTSTSPKAFEGKAAVIAQQKEAGAIETDRHGEQSTAPTLTVNTGTDSKAEGVAGSSLARERSPSTTDLVTPPVAIASDQIGRASSKGTPLIVSGSEQGKTDSIANNSVVNDQKDDLIEENKAEEKPVPEKIPTRWSVAVTVAPDFSSTSVGRYSAPGTAYGLFVSYRPLPRWQVVAGLIKTAKQYEGYGDEYQPPPGYWDNRTNGIIPDEVEGSCGIIEWPLILRFDVMATDRSRFYVTSGVSSYLMRHESYKYRFAQENPGAASGWSSSGPTSYAFSIGHLSAGYERYFSNRLSVAIEPYFKVPFKAIGWSNIDLHTTGAYLTVRYTFQKQSSIPTTQK